MMFKETESSAELAELMRRQMLATEAESTTNADKLIYAADCISKAATLFEDIGMHNEANALTQYLEKMAGK